MVTRSARERACVIVALAAAVLAGASCGPDKKSPTRPSAAIGDGPSVAAEAPGHGGAAVPASVIPTSGPIPLPADGAVSPSVAFPPRNEPYDFRLQLEAKYRDGLQRPASPTHVDLEGDIVWTQEYLRYRVNRCTHTEAVQRVMFQIDGGGALPACGDEPTGQVQFPPRNEPFDFRLQLEAKYRDGLKRPATSSHVDIEGDIVWTQEYIRYRVNYCDHYEATQRVFLQIDGRGVQPVCASPTPPTPPTPGGCPYPFCYYVSPERRTVANGGGSYTVAVTSNRSDGQWEVYSIPPWASVTSGRSGTGAGTVVYVVQANTGALGREGDLVVGGISHQFPPAVHRIIQAGRQDCGYPFCYSVSPSERTVSSAGGTYTFTMTSTSSSGQAGDWEVYSNPPWVTISGGRSGTGTGTVTYVVQANTSSASRSGDITVGGLSRLYPPAVHRVTQSGR